MNQLGIMQGRLTIPDKHEGIQFFPDRNRWKNEFKIAKELKLDYIEWIMDNPFKNPLFHFYGLNEISYLMINTGIYINSVCVDYFITDSKGLFEINYIDIFQYLLNQCESLNIDLITIPTMKSNFDFEELDCYLEKSTKFIKRNDMKIALEFDDECIDGILDMMDFLRRRDHGDIGITYDIGNNAEKNILSDLEILFKEDLVYHFHIKDKDKETGISVPLGQGDIKVWQEIFDLCKRFNYQGNFTLQGARGKSGYEKETIKDYMKWFNRFFEDKK